MTQFNEFNWNEPEDNLPLRYEYPNVKAQKKTSGAKIWIVAISCVLITAMITAGTLGAIFIADGRLDISSESGASRGIEGFDNAIEIAPASQGGAVETSVSVNSGQVLTIEEIAQQVGPAVVGVTCKVVYQSFFGAQSGTVTGSGIVIDDDGYVVTNYHVVEGAESVKVKLNTGKEYDAKYIGGDEQTDIAVLKIETDDSLTVAYFGDSDNLQVGELAVAIGNPMGDELFGTVTSGIISGLNRTIKIDDRYMTLIQTDAAINSGNSGGALINKYGQVIGINNAKLADGTTDNLSFAIPSNTVKNIVADLLDYGYVKGRPLIGITTKELNAQIAYYNGLPVDEGLYIMSISEGSAADLAGLQRGDIIVEFDGEKVTKSQEINDLRDKHKAGDTVKVKFYRGSDVKTIDLTLGENKPDIGL